jgi:hypothetical protein
MYDLSCQATRLKRLSASINLCAVALVWLS